MYARKSFVTEAHRIAVAFWTALVFSVFSLTMVVRSSLRREATLAPTCALVIASGVIWHVSHTVSVLVLVIFAIAFGTIRASRLTTGKKGESPLA